MSPDRHFPCSTTTTGVFSHTLPSTSGTQCSLHVRKNGANCRARTSTILWSRVLSEQTCQFSGRSEKSTNLLNAGIQSFQEETNCEKSTSRFRRNLDTRVVRSSRRDSLVTRWIIERDFDWCKIRGQRVFEIWNDREFWPWRYAGATLAAVVVQAMTCQDMSYAFYPTNDGSLWPTQMQSMMEFTASPWTETNSALFCGPRSDCLRNSLRRLSVGKSSLMRSVVGSGGKQLAILRTNRGLVSKRQVQGGSFRGLNGGQGGVLLGTTAPYFSLPALQLATISGSLTSPLATIVRAGLNLDFNVLRASFTSSLNLISLCTFVVWMQKSGQLPAETPVVLSQVAFRVLIPCFLMTKVALTLASHPAASLLFLPLIAVAQVLVGAILGKVACRLVFGKPLSVFPLKVESTIPVNAVPAAITTSVGGSGVRSQLEKPPRLDPPPVKSTWNNSETYMTAKKEAIITAACAFGNSFTLPLIFMTGVLAAEEASRVAGYLALYMVGWSPALWTVGYSIIATGDVDNDTGEDHFKDRFSWRALVKGFKQIMNPPLYGVLVGVLVGGTPLSHLFLPPVAGIVTSSETTAFISIFSTATAGILRPVFDAATLLGTATLAVQTVVLASSLAASLPRAKKTSRGVGVITEPPLDASRTTGGVGSGSPKLETLLDSRAFWIISSVRLVAMPVIVIISTTILQCARILPVDPVYNLTVLAEAAMPSGQNLVLLSQLRASTRPLSGTLADLLLRQYALSIIPITVWMAMFLALVRAA